MPRNRSSEIGLINRIRAKASGESPGLRIAIGDDCAVWKPPAGQELLFTTDLLVEDVHFRRAEHRPSDAGWKALARGLSDIAAMGGEPCFCLSSLSLPAGLGDAWIDRFYDGLLELAVRERCPLIGGDLSSGERIVCDIVVCGAVRAGKALTRSGARTGDRICVTGTLGGSALGLETKRGPAWRRHLRPEPRLEAGRKIRRHATAAMDLSDGLSIDLHRLCLESGVAAEIDGVPIFRGASEEQALHGGEDYELLFTWPSGRRIPHLAGGMPITPIGRIVQGPSGRVNLRGKRLRQAGWDHFRKR